MPTRLALWTTSVALAATLLAGCGGSGPVTTLPTTTAGSSPTRAVVPTGTPTRATAPTKRVPSRTTSARPTTRPKARTTPAPARPAPARDIVWIRTPVLTHDKDFHDFTPYLNPAVPRNWVSPVNYRDGDITMRIEIVGAHEPSAVPIYYLIGWTAGAGQGYARNGEKFDRASGVLEDRIPVKEWQRVVNGQDAGNVGDRWDWRHAFGQVNGDTWAANRGGELYPLKVRVTVTLHPKR